MNFPSIQPEQRFLYLYNFGRALEAIGRPREEQEAYAIYADAIHLRPGFEPASQRAFAILHRAESPRVADAVRLATLLIDKGSPALARDLLHIPSPVENRMVL